MKDCYFSKGGKMTSPQQFTKFDHTTGRHIRYEHLTLPNDLSQNNPSNPPGKRVKDVSFDQIPRECMRKLDKSSTSDKKFKSTCAQTLMRQFEETTHFIELPKYTKTSPALLKKEKRAHKETNSFTNPNLTKFLSGDGKVKLPDKKTKAKEVGEQRNILVEMWRTQRNAELQKRKLRKQREIESVRVSMEQEKHQRQLQCQIEYELWLEKKKRISLAKKIDVQERMMKAEEERRLRAEQSVKAYQTWLNVARRKFKKRNQINQ